MAIRALLLWMWVCEVTQKTKFSWIFYICLGNEVNELTGLTLIPELSTQRMHKNANPSHPHAGQ